MEEFLNICYKKNDIKEMSDKKNYFRIFIQDIIKYNLIFSLMFVCC